MRQPKRKCAKTGLGEQRKKARGALAGNTLPDPSQLMGEAPSAGLCVGKKQKQAMKKGKNWWVDDQFKDEGVVNRVTCKHDGKELSTKRDQQRKDHLNPNVCKFLSSKAAAELAPTVADVEEVLHFLFLQG